MQSVGHTPDTGVQQAEPGILTRSATSIVNLEISKKLDRCVVLCYVVLCYVVCYVALCYVMTSSKSVCSCDIT